MVAFCIRKGSGSRLRNAKRARQSGPQSRPGALLFATEYFAFRETIMLHDAANFSLSLTVNRNCARAAARNASGEPSSIRAT